MILLGLFFIVLAVYCLVEHKKSNKYFDKFIGPPSVAFIGADIIFCSSDDVLQKLYEYYKKYGGVFKIKLTPFSSALVLAEAKYLEFILSSSQFLDKGVNYKVFNRWVGLGLVVSTGATWKRHRKIITSAFHFNILEQFSETFNSASNILIRKLEAEIGKKSINVEPFISMNVLDVICETAMGVQLNIQKNENQEYIKNVNKLAACLSDSFFSPIKACDFTYQFTTAYKKEERAMRFVQSFTKNVILQRKAKRFVQTEENKRLAFLDLLLKVNEESKSLSDKELQQEVDTFMFTGYDTTSSAILFALYCISEHQEVQNKLFMELKDICESKEYITYNELQQMSYLECIIKETLRLYPSAPFITRTLKEDTEFDGKILPRDCIIFISPFLAHRDPKHFPEPEVFDPERFSNERSWEPYCYIPFSAGPRSCIGQRFAFLEIKTVIAKIILNFQLMPALPRQNLDLSVELALKPKHGIYLRIEKREEK